ncbi:MAG: NADH-quinone oxidoreductase subunit NuoE [Propionibacteriaceae bacterium]|jgi:NADH-quinone oxidoreductase subunit E|nr:NADH-quinone oxidoreductase subunit NuoE [Propionibacteriaceae bacterium]
MTDEPSRITEATVVELRELMGRYPQARSALIPMLHLVQSVDGCVSDTGVQLCADLLGISANEVLGVATFYTMFKRRPAGQHHIGICRTALCAVLGGDLIWDEVREKLGLEDGETTPDGKFSLEGIQCNAACDFAPVMTVDWEFMDNMTPERAAAIIDYLSANQPVRATRGPILAGFRASERVLAGFPDGKADEGPGAGEASVRGTRIAAINRWVAPLGVPIPGVTERSAGDA